MPFSIKSPKKVPNIFHWVKKDTRATRVLKSHLFLQPEILMQIREIASHLCNIWYTLLDGHFVEQFPKRSYNVKYPQR